MHTGDNSLGPLTGNDYAYLRELYNIFVARNPNFLNERLATLPYCTDYAVSDTSPGDPGPVWQYWGQGFKYAPAIVQRCVGTVKDHIGTRSYISINDNNILEYIQLPSSIFAKRHTIGYTQFSDFLRLCLLAQYGGTWIDATIYLSSSIPTAITSAPIFFFSRNADPFLISSWFIHASRGHPIILSLLHAQLKYYALFDRPSHYFMFHFMFESLVTCHPYLAQMYRDMPYWSAEPPHGLQSILDQEFDFATFDATVNSSWIHKLTYKHTPATDRYTYWHKLVDG